MSPLSFSHGVYGFGGVQHTAVGGAPAPPSAYHGLPPLRISGNSIRLPQAMPSAQNLQQPTGHGIRYSHSPATSRSTSRATSNGTEDEDDLPQPTLAALATSPAPSKPAKLKGPQSRSMRKKGVTNTAKAANPSSADIEVMEAEDDDGEKEDRGWTDDARYRLVEYVVKCENDLSTFKLKQAHHFDVVSV